MNLLNFIFKPAKKIEDEVTVARMEALRKATMRAQPPDSIIGGRIKVQENGWSLEIPKSSGGSAATIEPHEVISVGADKITINNGTVNNLITLPIGQLDHDPVEDVRYLVCRATMTANSGAQSAQYVVLSEPPEGLLWWLAGEEAQSEVDVLIAVIQNKKVTQIKTGNFFISLTEAHRIPKENINVGDFPFNIYYKWAVT
jgi:hypothetical protein